MPHEKTRIPVWVYFAVANVALVVVVVIALVAAWPRGASTDGASTTGAQAVQPGQGEPSGSATATSPAVRPDWLSAAEVVAAVKPAVVILKTYNSQKQEYGIATGFVVSNEGLIATNFHVLNRAWSATVRFSDGETRPVLGVRQWDVFTDLALLEIGDLPDSATAVTMNEDNSRTDAEEVVSIGHPEGLSFTTSRGILRGVYSEVDMPRQYRRFLNADFDHTWLQHSASIKGGSSGAPLLNLRGEVIGINASVSSDSGFAVDVRHLRTMLVNPDGPVESLEHLTGPGEELDQISRDFRAAAEQFNKKLIEIQDAEAREEFVNEEFPAIEYAQKMLNFARQHRASPCAFEAVTRLCAIATQQSAPVACNAPLSGAADLLADDYANDPRVADLVWSIQQCRLQGARVIAEKLAETTPRLDLQGIYYYCAAATYLASGSNDDLAAAQRLLNRVIRVYPNATYQCRAPQHPTHNLAEESKATLFQIKNRIGDR